MSYKTNIEAILSNSAINSDSQNMIRVLRKYLDNGGENLTKDQYFHVRALVESNYKKIVSNGLRNGEIHRDKDGVDETSHLLTDYLRYHHYRLLSNAGLMPEVNEQELHKENKKGFFNRIFDYAKDIKSNIEYSLNWKKKDDELYRLERILYKGKVNNMEANLISEIPSTGLSKWKIATFEMLAHRSQNPMKMQSLLNIYRTRKLKQGYLESVDHLNKAA
mgnify:FL=1